MSDEPPEMAEMLWAARRIWGYEPMDLRGVAECVAVVSGDLSRQGRALGEGRAPDMAQVAKELGNLMFSARRWMDDLGLDVVECLELAMVSQQEYADELRRDWKRPT